MSYLDVLAGRQEGSERRKASLQVQVEGYQQMAKDAIDLNNLPLAIECIQKMQQALGDVELIHEEECRCCSICGCPMVPHSMSWLEGFHIDGCDSLLGPHDYDDPGDAQYDLPPSERQAYLDQCERERED